MQMQQFSIPCEFFLKNPVRQVILLVQVYLLAVRSSLHGLEGAFEVMEAGQFGEIVSNDETNTHFMSFFHQYQSVAIVILNEMSI